MLSFLTLILFSALSMAGGVNTGLFSQKTISNGYSVVNGESISTQSGSGVAANGELFNGRIDTYTRNDSTVTEFNGYANTSKVTKTNGSNSGMTGSSVSVTKGTTDGYMNSVASVDNLVAGTYEQFTYDATGFNYESGDFSEGVQSTTNGYENYTTKFNAQSASAYTAY